MTCHIAFSNTIGAIMLSDSQASDASSERHGYQKQFCGHDFLLGGAGMGAVVSAVFRHLHELTLAGTPPIADTVERIIRTFLDSEVDPAARRSVEFILAAPSFPAAIRVHHPKVFRRFSPPTPFGAIGSGGEFVRRAILRDHALGLFRQPTLLVDLLVAGRDYADAANESLTVNDTFLVGFLFGPYAYMMGDGRVSLQYAPQPLREKWATEVQTQYSTITRDIQALRGQIQSAYRHFSAISAGGIPPENVKAIANCAERIAKLNSSITTSFINYCTWYNSTIGRTLP